MNGAGWKSFAENQQVGITVGRVLRRDPEQTLLHVIATTDAGIESLLSVRDDGAVQIHEGFSLFFAEGDKVLEEKLRRANVRIRIIMPEAGNEISAELIRDDPNAQGPAIS